MRGRKPKPIEQQIAEGDPRKKGKGKLQQELDKQVKATPGLPKCPKHLTGDARWFYNFALAELSSMKMDKRPDGPMLEGAAVMFARARQADRLIVTDGPIVDKLFVNEDEEVIVLDRKKHPAVEISRQCWSLCKTFCSEFGMTLLSRLRLHPDGDDEDDEDQLLKNLSAPRVPRAGSTMVQ